MRRRPPEETTIRILAPSSVPSSTTLDVLALLPTRTQDEDPSRGGDASTRLPLVGTRPSSQVLGSDHSAAQEMLSSITPTLTALQKCEWPKGEALGEGVGGIDGSALFLNDGDGEGECVGKREGDVGIGVTEGAGDG